MMILSLSLVGLTVVLGGVLLLPRHHILAMIPRGALALCHGATGTVALVLLYRALLSSSVENPVGWVAAVLISVGLLAGGVILIEGLRRRKPPVLVVVLHVIMAGMGAMLLIGFALA